MQNRYMGTLEEAAQSYAHWWREAGFHTATDPVAHGWRQAPAAPFWQQAAARAETPAPVAAPVQARVAEPVATPPRVIETPRDMPATLPALRDWIAQDAAQPEAAWDGAMILPPVAEQARLLVIVEMPAIDARDDATLLDPVQRRFLDALVTSIGVRPDEALVTPLAARRPPGGLLDETTLGRLAARMTHYLGLARPQATILLGDRTSRALVGPEWTPGGVGLQKINLGEGRIEAIPLPGLDLLMNRPAAKARSWQALRLLNGQMTR